jgi:hypothetical protein
MERSGKTTAKVTVLRARRVRAAAPPIGGRRGGGRMWINGREVGDPDRFRHLASPPG